MPRVGGKGAVARGEVDVLKPGDEGYGRQAESEARRTGLHVEKGFRHRAGAEPQNLLRVYAPDPEAESEEYRVLLSLPEKDAKFVYEKLKEHFGK